MKKTKLTAKQSRREGVALSDASAHARALSRRPNTPGQQGVGRRPRRMTDYGKQLREKQKTKRMYGMTEKQFSNLFAKVSKKKGDTALMFVQQLEARLDNTVYRAGFAKTRAAARQAVSHAHFYVNGGKMNIASYTVRAGDVIQLRDNKREKTKLWKEVEENLTQKETPSWISVDPKMASVKVTGLPSAEEIHQQPFDSKMIIEFYSR